MVRIPVKPGWLIDNQVVVHQFVTRAGEARQLHMITQQLHSFVYELCLCHNLF